MVGIGVAVISIGIGAGIIETVSVVGIPLVFFTGGALVVYGSIAVGAGVFVTGQGFSILGSAFC